MSQTTKKAWGNKKAAPKKGDSQRVTIFPKGIFVFNPHENAPEFIKADIILTPSDLFDWLGVNADLLQDTGHGEQIRLTLKESQKGSLYLEVNTFKKTSKASNE